MIRHDYECGECGHIREYEHPMGEDPAACEHCGAPGLVKKVCAPFVSTPGKGSDVLEYGYFVVDNMKFPVGVVREVRRDILGGRGQIVERTARTNDGEGPLVEHSQVEIDLT